jgi:hypothetical protein
MINFSDLKSVISVLDFLHLKLCLA